jgi:DNA-binding NtrC family response regulator
MLVRYFALNASREKDLPPRPFTAEAQNLIASHNWQGDLFALRSTIRHAVLMTEGPEIGAEAIRLPDIRSHPSDANDWNRVESAVRTLMGQLLADVEREFILLTLEGCLGDRGLTAEVLGISVRTLRNKLKVYAQSGMPVFPAKAGSMHHRHPVKHGPPSTLQTA